MRVRTIAVAGLAAGLAAARPGPAMSSSDAAAMLGNWLTEDGGGVIAVERCGDALCGRIVGVVLDHPNDPVPTDAQGRSQCGLMILRDAVPEGSAWEGHITDPRDGKVYRARLSLDPAGRLRLRGYVGVPLLGSTQVWSRYAATPPPDCRLVAAPGGDAAS